MLTIAGQADYSFDNSKKLSLAGSCMKVRECTWHEFMCHAEVHKGCGAVVSDPDAVCADVQQADPQCVDLNQRLRAKRGCSDNPHTLAV